MTGEQRKDASGAPEKPFFEIVGGNPSPVEVGILSAFATAQGNAALPGEPPSGSRTTGAYEDRPARCS